MHRTFTLALPIFILLVLWQFTPSYAQHVQGQVTDARSGEPLAFVNILVQDSRQGTMTDIDGNFRLFWPAGASQLQLSYVGYFSTSYEVDASVAFHHIQMHPQPVQLAEVVVYPGENPAHRIILNAIAHRQQNNPENLNAFSYTSYNKVVASPGSDYFRRRFEARGDSADFRLAQSLEQRYFFIMESVSQRKYRYPALNNEKVIANRVSGMENPLFTMLATELQPFAFYENFIRLMEKNYLSPLNSNAFSRYFYHLEDTLYHGQDSVFIVSFRPGRNTRFEGLKGLLYIHGKNWGLQNVIAQPANSGHRAMDFKIQQKYALQEEQYWFPVQLNTNIEIFSHHASIDTDLYPVYISGRSYISDIVINPEFSRRDFSPYDVDFDPRANQVTQDYWQHYRAEGLSTKEENTYEFLDSLGRVHNFERIMNTTEILSSGEIPLGELSLPINELYRFNAYEKHRVGVGLKTNRRLSRHLEAGGYYAWGSGDKESKYGYRGHLVLSQRHELQLGGFFQRDVQERGATHFKEKRFLLSPDYFRSFYTNTMDITRQSGARLSLRMWRNALHTELVASRGKTWWHDPYYFARQGESVALREFRFAEATLRLRFAWGETFMKAPLRLIQLPGPYPVFHFNITRGFDNIDRGEFNYLKMEARLNMHYPIALLGKQSWIIESGWANRTDIPWPLLFTARAAHKQGLMAAPFSFSNMHINEFVADKYLAVFFRHNFGGLLFQLPGYAPDLVFIHNMGWGRLRETQSHYYTSLQGWEKGYFESGIGINKILPRSWDRSIMPGLSPGLEMLYRYGPYAFEKPSENFTAKISLVLSF